MKLQVVMLDKFQTDIALMHQNECVPFGRRLVSVELTPEQIKALEPRFLGKTTHVGIEHAYHEEIGHVWLEGTP